MSALMKTIIAFVQYCST